MSAIASDIVEEAARLLGRASEREVLLRLLGGLAVRLHSPGGIHPALERRFNDVDFVSRRSGWKEIPGFFEEMGYESQRAFNRMNAGRRLMFHDNEHDRRIDVFLGAFEMCHAIPLEERIAVDPVTIPLAELLLTKLQIVELNDKDLRDVLALLHEHEVGEGDGELINGRRIARLCARDWGLWRTCQLNLERVQEAVETYGFAPGERQMLSARLEELSGLIQEEPKSTGWKLRARIGDRMRWYQEPDEIDA